MGTAALDRLMADSFTEHAIGQVAQRAVIHGQKLRNVFEPAADTDQGFDLLDLSGSHEISGEAYRTVLLGTGSFTNRPDLFWGPVHAARVAPRHRERVPPLCRGRHHRRPWEPAAAGHRRARGADQGREDRAARHHHGPGGPEHQGRRCRGAGRQVPGGGRQGAGRREEGRVPRRRQQGQPRPQGHGRRRAESPAPRSPRRSTACCGASARTPRPWRSSWTTPTSWRSWSASPSASCSSPRCWGGLTSGRSTRSSASRTSPTPLASP